MKHIQIPALFLGLFSIVPMSSASVLDLFAAQVTASSNHSAPYTGNFAFDGNSGTRWASATSPGHVIVDLGQDYELNSVTIDWETANASSYSIGTRSDAQGPGTVIGDFAIVASASGVGAAPGGGASGTDHFFDFAPGNTTDQSGLCGAHQI